MPTPSFFAHRSCPASPLTQQVTPGLTKKELREHIADCGWHLQCAYAHFEAHGNPADRDAAVQWLYAQQEAQRALQRHLADGLDYFAAAGARDREILERRAA